MNANHDFDRIAQAWLAEGADQLPDRVLDSVVSEIHTTRQRSSRRWPWWIQTFPAPIRIALAIIVLAAGAGIGAGLVGRSSNVGPPPTSPTTPTPSDTSTWTPFQSSRYGFDVKHPADWTEQRSTVDWTFADGVITETNTTMLDQVVGPGNHPTFSGRSMALPDGMTTDDWIARYTAEMSAQCYPRRSEWEPTTIDGYQAAIAYGGCFNYEEAIAFVRGRAFVFSLVDTSPPADPAPLKTFLSTVRFTLPPVPPPPNPPSAGFIAPDGSSLSSP